MGQGKHIATAAALLVGQQLFANQALALQPNEVGESFSNDRLAYWADLIQSVNGKPFFDPSKKDNEAAYLVKSFEPGWEIEELKQTVAAMGIEGSATIDENHPRCRFPARYYWLGSELSGKPVLPPLQCESLHRWLKKAYGNELVLSYIGSYLSNPASAFGHTILTFEQEGIEGGRADDLSIDYGAGVPPNENPVLYVYRGLTGGYFASFTDGNYGKHTQTYQKQELRSIWRYELDLTESQRELMALHIAEAIGKKTEYRFLSENCAWGIGRSLQNILQIPMGIPQSPAWFSPVELVSIVHNTENPATGRPLVGNRKFVTSDQDLLLQMVQRFDARTMAHYKMATEDEPVLSSEDGGPLKAEALDAALFYWHSKHLSSKEEAFKVQKNKVLQARLKQPAAPVYKPENTVSENQTPHLFDAPGYVRAGLHSSRRAVEGGKTNEKGVSLKIAAFDNSSDTLHGLGVGREMEVASVKIHSLGGGLQINEITALKVKALGHDRLTGLGGIGSGLSWSLELGAKRLDTQVQSKERVQGEGFKGLDGVVRSTIGVPWVNGNRTASLDVYGGFELTTGSKHGYLIAGAQAEYRPNSKLANATKIEFRPLINGSGSSQDSTGTTKQVGAVVRNQTVFKIAADGTSAVFELWSSRLNGGAEISVVRHF